MLELDGGDAGGGYLRTALALSVLTDRPVRVANVRGDRPEPGLKPQHAAAVEAVAEVCDATVTGTEHGATTVTFEPGGAPGGVASVDVGTAGSVTLVFDTVVPLAMAADAPIRLRATGGTDVAWSPPLTTYRRVKLPLLRRLGVPVAVDASRRGFYPVGGGAATLTLAPANPSSLDLGERGHPEGVRVYSLASEGLADADVAERQADAAVEALDAADRRVRERVVSYVDSESPGSVCTVRADYGTGVAGLDALGEQGKPAEDVGREPVEALEAFEGTGAAIDRHLADQLLPFLAVAGGTVTVPEVTAHVESGLDLLAAFGCDVAVTEESDRVRLQSDGLVDAGSGSR
ncbi:RNA 3'-terminal-phosphate cyclase [Halorientalis sp. IM1011]|uniref:RNA 3'-terminal phosphate cyclase n=1 Tax=Halorientalis sp. IM1011 TaxID=1932360 RepID=UPI00097CCD11|nr:RNA 3'-terminal phosphate cyclase [Halorientalis sp. IM1011]AQL42657.1 RNA 3'-terminal-phosphate cyclase [Halorientalis sp. IM1011]